MKKLKICLVHEEYPEETNFGGIATYEKIMAETLVKLGHDVYVICRGLKKNKKYIENGVRITRIHIKETSNQVTNYIEYRKKVSEILKLLQEKEKIDIIEVPDWGAETILFENLRTVPIVVRLHTPLKVWLKFNKNKFGKVTKEMLKWEKKMIETADLLTCCSQALKKLIVKDFNVKSEDIIVTPNPANLSHFYRDSKIEKNNSIIYVGSLEERKGVYILAKALNVFFEKFPQVQMVFIGKDTERNRKNISTIELIKKTVKKKYHSNLLFLGQLPNYEINKYLNASKLAVFPSLFDNFPYVVLEAMSVGIQTVGSKNSGMVEMLNDKSSIYKTGKYKDLAEVMCKKYKLSFSEPTNTKNIERVNNIYNAENVAINMVEKYNEIILEYHNNNIPEKTLYQVLKHVDKNCKITESKKEKKGVSNTVFKIVSGDKKYIIKKYLYDYNFELSENLYKIYNENGINAVKPLNSKVIENNNSKYNVFEYINSLKNKKKISDKFLFSLLICERKTKKQGTLLKKVESYYNYLEKVDKSNLKFLNQLNYTLKIFSEIKNNKILEEQFLNHGDLSKSNILITKNANYVIDFDETTVTTWLYDFAVIVIKNYLKKDKIDPKKYNKLKELLKTQKSNYTSDDLKTAINYYLCKILLEKFFLDCTGKINLSSKNQRKDHYNKYFKILYNFNEKGIS